MSRIAIAAGICALFCASASSAQNSGTARDNARPPLIQDTVRFLNGNVAIAATVVRPNTTARSAAVVILHGSGNSARDNPWTSAYATALAARGVIVVHPDKRGSGQSTGDWRTASMQDLAGDATAAIRWLRLQAWVDTTRIGVVGFSQGGYIASVMAADDPTIAFAASISASTLSFRDQTVDEVVMDAERSGKPLSVAGQSAVRDSYEAAWSYAMGRIPWTDYSSRLSRAKAQSAAVSDALRTLPADSTLWVWKWVRSVGEFDPMTFLARTRVPMLFVYGARDTNVRVPASIARLWKQVAADPSRFSTIVLGGNTHALFRDDATDFLATWIKARGAS